MSTNGKKVCFFIASLNNAGGTERVCTAIANKLSTLGFDVTILTMYSGVPFFEPEPSVKLVHVYQSKSFSKLLIPATLLRIRKLISQIHPHVFVNVDSALFAYSQMALAGLNIKNIVWEHFHYNAARSSAARRLSRKLAAKHAHAIITLTTTDEQAWQSDQPCKAKVLAINNPAPQVIANNTITKNNVVLSVGRLNDQKGFDRLLDAWKIVAAQIDNWQLQIVGSGELKGELERQAQQLGITGAVEFIAATQQVHRYFESAGIYCLSSRYEGFPMVLLEAQAFGLPIVSFDCETGPAEIITHNGDGLLVKNGDIQGLADALLALITDEHKRRAMGEQAKTNSARYHIDSIIKHWQNLLTEN